MQRHQKLKSNGVRHGSEFDTFINISAIYLAIQTSKERARRIQGFLSNGLTSIAQLVYIRAMAYQCELLSLEDVKYSTLFALPWREVGYATVFASSQTVRERLLPTKMIESMPGGIRRALREQLPQTSAIEANQIDGDVLASESAASDVSRHLVMSPLPARLEPISKEIEAPGSQIFGPSDQGGMQRGTEGNSVLHADAGDLPCQIAPVSRPISPGHSPILTRRDCTPPKPSLSRQAMPLDKGKVKPHNTPEEVRDDAQQAEQAGASASNYKLTSSVRVFPKHSLPQGTTGEDGNWNLEQHDPAAQHRSRTIVRPPLPKEPMFEDLPNSSQIRRSPAPRELANVSPSAPAAYRPNCRRLTSLELIPDRFRYQQGCSIQIQLQPQRSSGDDNSEIKEQIKPPPAIHPPRESRATTEQSVQDLVQTPAQTSFRPPIDRRAAALSDSDRSSVSSTDSSRARKALAFSLDDDKTSWAPNAAKSTASLGFSSARGVFKTLVDSVKPTGSGSAAQAVTEKLSIEAARSPRQKRRPTNLGEICYRGEGSADGCSSKEKELNEGYGSSVPPPSPPDRTHDRKGSADTSST